MLYRKSFLLLLCVLLGASVMAQIPSAYRVGTWRDFKPAAVSYTFDDNTSNQIPVAIPLFDNYGFRTTLFTVTQSMNPNWNNIRNAASKGHEIASHTVTHADLSNSNVQTQDNELKNSQSTINTQIPSQKCVTVAYPNCNIGDVSTIQKYYIAGRTCSGQIIQSNPTDFYRLSSIICGNQGVNTANDMNTRLNSAKSSGGWAVFLLHGIDNDGGYSPLSSSVLSSHLSHVNTNKADFWVGTFGEVVKYIKERNALSINETTVNADSIRITPTDNLDNSIYNVPVTVRRQLPSGWQNGRVRSGSAIVPSSIVTDNGTSYIQFDVIPDNGVYTLANADKSSDNPGTVTSESCTEPGEGAFHTGVYRNMFKEVLGKTDSEVNAKVNAAFQHIFYGSANQKLYYETGSDMAYILDVHNNDVRSEGMSYGMMICLQLDKKAEFDKLWRWTRQYMQHRSGNLNGYFAWQLRTDGSIIDNNPAPDGEAYFVTALFFAAHRWGNGTGIFNYEAEAQDILNKVMSKNGSGGINNLFNSNSKLITFGPNGGSYDYTDPSYNLPGFWELWSRWSATNQSFWAQTPAASRKLLRDASHPVSGLSADYSEFDGTPKATSFNADANKFMYDAWRTIMNIGMDYHWFKADSQQPVIAERYLNFFKNQGSGYKNHYNWDGSNAHGDHSTGLVACNAVASLAVSNTTLTRPFLEEFWNIGIPSGTYRYYDGMLYMLAILNCSGQFKVWKPECEDACQTPAPAVTAVISYELGETATPLSASGTSLKWYTSSAGGTALANAPTPNTSAAGTTTYYVSQTLNDCEGPRAEITVHVSYIHKIYKTAAAPVIDGTADALWLNPDSKEIWAENVILPTVSGPADLSGSLKLLWDNDYVYFYAEVTDDVKQNDSQNSYEDDAIEIYFDINNDKATSYGANDVQYSFGWNDGTVVGALPSGRSVAGIVYTAVSTAEGYNVEGRIPWTTLQSSPLVGQLIGIEFMINDDDNGGGRDGKLAWNATTDDAWQNPSLFGTGILSDLLPDVVTSLSYDKRGSINVYPTTPENYIQVEGMDGSFEYRMLDARGIEVLKGTSAGTINVSRLSSGMYLLHLRSNQQEKTVRILK